MLEVPVIHLSSAKLYLSVLDIQHPSLAAWRTSDPKNLPMSFGMFWWVTGGLGAALTILKISLIKLWSKSSRLHGFKQISYQLIVLSSIFWSLIHFRRYLDVIALTLYSSLLSAAYLPDAHDTSLGFSTVGFSSYTSNSLSSTTDPSLSNSYFDHIPPSCNLA